MGYGWRDNGKHRLGRIRRIKTLSIHRLPLRIMQMSVKHGDLQTDEDVSALSGQTRLRRPASKKKAQLEYASIYVRFRAGSESGMYFSPHARTDWRSGRQPRRQTAGLASLFLMQRQEENCWPRLSRLINVLTYATLKFSRCPSLSRRAAVRCRGPALCAVRHGNGSALNLLFCLPSSREQR